MSTNFISVPFVPEEWISQADAARLRGVSRQAIAKLLKNGRLKSLTIGSHVFVNRSEVLAFEPRRAGRPKGTG